MSVLIEGRAPGNPRTHSRSLATEVGSVYSLTLGGPTRHTRVAPILQLGPPPSLLASEVCRRCGQRARSVLSVGGVAAARRQVAVCARCFARIVRDTSIADVGNALVEYLDALTR